MQQEIFLQYDADAKKLVSQMTLDEKVGQMIQPDQKHLKNITDIETYFLGSLLSGGGSSPARREDNTLRGWAAMVDGYQQHSQKTRLKIPLLYGVDAVHGHNNVPGAVIFPHNIGLGCARDADLVEQISKFVAQDVRATGINWTFSPCITVPQDIRWGRTYEGYSEDPCIVSELGAACVRGFQQGFNLQSSPVLACAKHFAADGGTSYGSTQRTNGGLDQGNAFVSEEQLKNIHLYPYIQCVKEGVGTIMPSYSSINGLKCSANGDLMNRYLKQELGFEGFVISDYNAIDQITEDYKLCADIAINAGIDMIMCTGQYIQLIENIKQLVNEGYIKMERIDDAVVRILRVKFAVGLMERSKENLQSLLYSNQVYQPSFNSQEKRALARKAVSETIVILKNKNNVLPLKKSQRIMLLGRGADCLGMQCGGWTISWNGSMDNVITDGTSILLAFQEAMLDQPGEVFYSKDGKGDWSADVAVAVIGETPYAEMEGDRHDLSISTEDFYSISEATARGIPTIVILLSGRPLIVSSIINQIDALVAAWLPGSEGAGVTDVLFNDVKPRGTLSYSWPKCMEQIPFNKNAGAKEGEGEWGFGHGLTYE